MNSYKSTSGHIRFGESQIYAVITIPFYTKCRPHSTPLCSQKSYLSSLLFGHVSLLLAGLWGCSRGPLASHLFPQVCNIHSLSNFQSYFFSPTKEFEHVMVIIQNTHTLYLFTSLLYMFLSSLFSESDDDCFLNLKSQTICSCPGGCSSVVSPLPSPEQLFPLLALSSLLLEV